MLKMKHFSANSRRKYKRRLTYLSIFPVYRLFCFWCFALYYAERKLANGICKNRVTTLGFYRLACWENFECAVVSLNYVVGVFLINISCWLIQHLWSTVADLSQTGTWILTLQVPTSVNSWRWFMLSKLSAETTLTCKSSVEKSCQIRSWKRAISYNNKTLSWKNVYRIITWLLNDPACLVRSDISV